MTKSPFFGVDTSLPVSSTTPMNSCPMGLPCLVEGMPWYGCRSEPQMQELTIRTMASVGFWMTGSGTSEVQLKLRVPVPDPVDLQFQGVDPRVVHPGGHLPEGMTLR